MAVLGQLGDQLLGVLGAHEDGEARLRRLALGLGQQRDGALDDGGAIGAVGRADVVEEQAVEAALVVGLVEQRADAGEEGLLGG